MKLIFFKVFPLLQSRFQTNPGANVKVLKGWRGCSINIQKWNSLDEEFLAKYRNCTSRAPDYDSFQHCCHKSSKPLRRSETIWSPSSSCRRWVDVVDLQNPWHTLSPFERKKMDSNQVLMQMNLRLEKVLGRCFGPHFPRLNTPVHSFIGRKDP